MEFPLILLLLTTVHKLKSTSLTSSSSDFSLSEYSPESCEGSKLFIFCHETKKPKPKPKDKDDDYNIKIHHPKSDIIDFRGTLRQKFVVTLATMRPRESVICSPISALLPLGQLAYGAKSDTLLEIFKAIGVYKTSKFEKHFKKLLKNMDDLSIANRIFLSNDQKLMKSFKKNAESVFRSSIELVNMKDPIKVATKVNNWAERKTHGKITGIIRANDITPKTSLVLVNVIYFKGKWKMPFTSEYQGKFYGVMGHQDVTMMTVEGSFMYAKSSALDAEIVEIPYTDKDLTMMIILPIGRSGLPLLLNQIQLAPTIINSVQLTKTKLKLVIPRFTIRSEWDLADLYTKIGLSKMMSARYGFTKIVENEKLYVSKAIQKAFIEVTKEGTTATAASEVGVSLLSWHGMPTEFKAEHPFLFYIIDNKQQVFAGVLNDTP